VWGVVCVVGVGRCVGTCMCVCVCVLCVYGVLVCVYGVCVVCVWCVRERNEVVCEEGKCW